MNVTLKYETGAADLARDLFGRDVSDEELAAAAGALDGAALNVSVRKGSELFVEIVHPLIVRQERGFRRDANRELYVWNHHFEKRHDAPPGVGLRSFKTQVEGARRLDVRRVELWAAGDLNDRSYNGYLTWAIFGFDAPLTAEEQQELALSPQLAGAQTVNELFQRGGRDWWRVSGTARGMRFELSDDSSMMQIFRSHLKSKGLLEEL
ncbi:MAG: hypothetical protein ACREEM_04675 [Blastocatellia bacterium]